MLGSSESLNARETCGPDEAEQCWRAVLARDSRCDGTFVYAVASTGIYCRPSCPARRPRRDQVRFFATPEAAAQAGFRPCRRCRPDEVHAQNAQAELVQTVCRYIEANLDGTLTLEALGAHANVSPHHLQRTFKRVTGISPRQYAEACRLGSLKAHLREGQAVTHALYEAGYGSSSRLYERAADQIGMTPATYRKGGQGMHVGYTIVDCPLGRLLVAATERGICAVSLGDADATLELALREEYPAAEIYRDDAGFAPWVQSILDYLSGAQPHLDLPLDVRATAFQWRVWEALRKIPYGSTRTYGEIACDLGQPTATRAVARACATNPVSLVVPCHRVVGADGSLRGYRWGVERKRALLEQEQALPTGERGQETGERGQETEPSQG
jgi:AraC family transcriptional regulator of adaptative response/methylated-DNA-[protein]-cysteine methyltransferase